MGFNSRILALLLSGLIALVTTAFLYLVEDSSIIALAVTFFVAFGISFLLIYMTLEFFIFQEIDKIHSALRKIKKEEFAKVKKRRRFASNPLRSINDEIFDMAQAKELEIEQLKQAAVYRRDFLANVSHELKTPIFSAQGFVHTLIDGAEEDMEVRKKFLKKAARSLDQLDNLVQDLIVISQIESGEITMQREYIDLSKLVEDIFDQLERKAKNRKTKLVLTTDIDGPAEVYADTRRMKQVFTNLVDNAIKYGKDEKGTVEVKLMRGTSERKLDVSISDDGPGMGAEHLGRVFERFYRVDKSRSREKGGTGLGLAIVKHILERHDSKIDVESKKGKGTTFHFTLKNPKE